MAGKKKGMPLESELVLCTVAKIYPHCVFVDIDDYEDKQGMINISEIAPGRIRNINDFVRMGKKIVCKVLRIDREKGHIDLSLRRVTESQRREKAELIKKEQKAEKIVEFVAQRLKIEKQKLYNDLAAKTASQYPTLHDLFEDFIVNESALKSLGLPQNVYDALAEVIQQRIKPPEVTIDGEIRLKTYAPNGVNVIKDIISAAEKTDSRIVMRYLGGGSYGISVTHDNFKDAEKVMKAATDVVEQRAKRLDCEFSFERIEKKQKKAEA
jgi:translation initiation factor 2 subunit 1